MASKLSVALSLAARGFRVFPLKPGAKAPPLLAEWPTKATSDPKRIELLWAAMPDANVAIHCEGLAVLDVDVAKGGDDNLASLADLYDIPETLTTRTPTGGRHLFFRLPEGHPGVSNSVGRLGQGLDVRSTGGYVVAPGSDVEAGRYHFVAGEVPIAQAPEWLLRLLEPVAPRKEKLATPVADAPPSALQRAASWLASHPGAVEGQGGDAYTYQTACKLRDFGVSEPQCVEMLTQWNDTCSPPWDLSTLRQKARNAYRYAQEPVAGKLGVTAEDFPVLPESGIDVPKKGTQERDLRTSRVQRLSEFAKRESRGQYLVKGLLQKASFAVAYGAPGEGKSFVALDLAYHVAAGLPWMEHKVRPGPTVYLAYEGMGGLSKRAQALRQHYGDADVPLYIVDASYNLKEQSGRHALRDDLAALPEKPALIVVDTLAHVMSAFGGDENSAQDMGAVNAALNALVSATGACVLLIHHTGKNKAAGARGSSALFGAIDTEIEIEAHKITPTKQRDIELAEPTYFRLHPVIVGMDEDGDSVTSCVVMPAQAPISADLVSLRGIPRDAFGALCDLAPDNSPVSVKQWRETCVEFMGTTRLNQRFYEVKKLLLDKGYIVVENDYVTRRME